MNRISILGLGLVGALGVGTVTAQPGGRGPAANEGQGPHGRGLGPVVRVLDADQDGTISADEIAGAPQVLITLDSDGDGALTQEDLRPRRTAKRNGKGKGDHRRRGGRAKPMLDVDSNGAISREEFLAPAQAHFQQIDEDGDGAISLEEFLAKPTEKFNQLDTEGTGEIDASMERKSTRRAEGRSRSNCRSKTR